MCNLYRMTRSQDEIRRLFPDLADRAGNLALLEGIYPDYAAPIVRIADGAPELAMARWSMPSPAFALKGKKTDRGVTNIRNTGSPHWRRWLGPGHRCLVPLTAFSEPETRKGKGRGRETLASRTCTYICINKRRYGADKYCRLRLGRRQLAEMR